ncbi:MAG: substrate-binding domain-containing protein [Firmicutes bacterium]|nr:substrate-binding domain-containing protein [Bacillota bacterium]
MKRKFFAAAAAMLLLPMLSSCMKGMPEEKKKIAVITKSTTSTFWHNVEKGVNAAATEHNIDVTFEGPESEEDYITQNMMIRRAAENGADAIVLSAIDYKKSADAVSKAHDSGIKIVIMDSAVDSTKINAVVGTDNSDAGKTAAMAAVSSFKDDEKKYIGIVNIDKNSYNVRRREQGFREYIQAVPNAEIVDTVNVSSNTGSATTGAVTMLRNHPEINIIVGFNEWTTLGVGYAVRQMELSGKVRAIGFDTNVVSIAMLETGEMDALVVQNPFSMGYIGVESAAKLISGKSTSENIVTETRVITKDNMFDESSQKLLFPFE